MNNVKKCEFCNEDENETSSPLLKFTIKSNLTPEMDHTLGVWISKDLIELISFDENNGYTLDKQTVNFCPVCGRKLKNRN